MNRWQIICPVCALLVVSIFAARQHAHVQQKLWIISQSREIGRELIQSNSSPRVLLIGQELKAQLIELTSHPTHVMSVELGDDVVARAAKAQSRLFLSNSMGETIAIRLRQSSQAEQFEILSFNSY